MEANSAKLRSLIALFVLAGIFPTFGLAGESLDFIIVSQWNRTLHLNWNAVQQATSYRIYRVTKGNEDATFLFETYHTEAVLRQRKEGGALLIKSVTEKQVGESGPIVNLTANINRTESNSIQLVQYSLRLLSVTTTSATVSITVDSISDKAPEGFVSVNSAMGVQEFDLIPKVTSADSIQLSNLEPGLDYTISVSPKREQIPSIFLAFKTRHMMYNTEENGVLILNLTTGTYKHIELSHRNSAAAANKNIRQVIRRQTAGTSRFTSFSPVHGVDSVPLNYRTKKISSSLISVCWESPIAKDVQRYRLLLFTEGRLQIGPIYLLRDQLEFNFTKLYPNTTYFVVIDALYYRGFGSPVSLKVTTLTGDEPVPNTAPQEAVSASAAVINNTLVSLSWSAVPRANLYNIQGGFGESSIDTNALTLVTQLRSIFFLIAKNLQGMTNRVDLSRPPGNEETLGRQESSPRNLMIIHVTDTTATLHWTPPLSDVRLSEYRCTVTRNNLLVDSSIAVTQICSLKNLRPGLSYQFSVTAVNSISTSPSVTITINKFPSIEPAPLPAPTNVTGELVIQDEVLLSWNAVTGAVSYSVFQFENKTTTMLPFTTRLFLSVRFSGSTFYQVAAVDSNGAVGLRSEVVRIQPVRPEDQLPAPVIDVVRTSCNDFILNWQPIDGARDYLVLFQNSNLGQPLRRVSGTRLSLSATEPRSISISALNADNVEGMRTSVLLTPCSVSASCHGNVLVFCLHYNPPMNT